MITLYVYPGIFLFSDIFFPFNINHISFLLYVFIRKLQQSRIAKVKHKVRMERKAGYVGSQTCKAENFRGQLRYFVCMYVCICFWLHWVFVAASGGYSSLQCVGFSLRWLLLLRNMGSRHVGFSSWSSQAQQLRCTGLVALWHVGSSRTRARTRVPCFGRQILNHCATGEIPVAILRFSVVTVGITVQVHEHTSHSFYFFFFSFFFF